MRNLVLYILIFFFGNAYSQEWRDSLETARQLYKKKDYGKALKYYESAQKKAPEDIDLSDEIGQSAYKAREFERSEKVYQQNTSNKRGIKEKAENYHNLGNTRMNKKNYQGAIEAYKEALKNNPNDEQTRYNLSQAIRRLKAEKEKQDKNQDKNNQDNNQQNNSQNNKNQGNQNQGNQNQQQGNQNQQKGNQGNQGNQNKNQGNKGNNGNQNSQKNNSKNGDADQGQNGNSKIPNKSVERMLDQLMKAEANTKRKIGGNMGDNTTNQSGKDW
jgi:Ca-activated chloride channel family protein